jgi:DNA-binding PadR family transcriptional regulator
MEIPDKFVQQWIIIVMGKRDKLSGKQIYSEVKKEKECSKTLLPIYPSAYYESLVKLENEGFVEQIGSKPVRGTVEKFYTLTHKGKKAFNEIRDTFVIQDILSFAENQESCLECESKRIEKCWRIFAKDLEITLRDMPSFFPSFHLKPPSDLKQEFITPNNLREFIFWLKMLKLPRKRLKEKFETQLSQLGLTIK